MSEIGKPRVDHCPETHVRTVVGKNSGGEFKKEKAIVWSNDDIGCNLYHLHEHLRKWFRRRVLGYSFCQAAVACTPKMPKEVTEKRSDIPDWVEDPAVFNQLGNRRCWSEDLHCILAGHFWFT